MTEEKSSVKGFGSKLKLEREARDISLEEISRVTKISIHLLHAMEEDDWDALPGGIFTRNFIRLFANHLGLEGERWVDEFKHFIKTKHKAEGSPSEDSSEEEKFDGPELPQGMVYGLIGLAVIIIIGGYLLISNFSFGGKDKAPADNSSEVVRDDPAVSEVVEDAPVIEEPAVAVDGLKVELKETGARCWYQWWGDGQLKTPAEGANLKTDVSVSLEADGIIKLYMAHLQGVELSVNGEKRQWSEFNPDSRKDAEGKITGYVVEIKKVQGE